MNPFNKCLFNVHNMSDIIISARDLIKNEVSWENADLNP